MKSIIKTTVLCLFVALASTACHKDLNIVQKGALTTNEAWASAEDAETCMNGMMSQFRAAYASAYMYWGEYRTGLWGEGMSSRPVSMNIFQNVIDQGNTYADWQSLYTTINTANVIMKHAPELDFSGKEARYNKVMGTAHYVRAFCYYWIARLWGDAPLQLKGLESYDLSLLYPFKASKAEILAQVESDLTAAGELLKDVAVQVNVPNIHAVNTLKTDYYLWMNKVEGDDSALAKARTACDAVLGKRSLLPAYADIFDVKKKNNDEEIFIWSMVRDEKEGGFQEEWLIPLQYCTTTYHENPVKVGSHQQWMFLTPAHQEFLTADKSDTRAKVTFDSFYDSGTKLDLKWINKYAGTWENKARIFNSDIIVYRYADVLLFDAEIALEEGNADKAIDQINVVAKRAYGKDNFYSKGQSVAAVKEILINERLKEFTAEGKLWFDYIRMGVVFDKVPALKGKENKKNILLWPVSKASLDDNKNLQQTEIEY